MRLIIFILGCFFILSGTQSYYAVEIGSEMPKISQQMKGVDGKYYTLAGLKSSKAKLVIFSLDVVQSVPYGRSTLVIY